MSTTFPALNVPSFLSQYHHAIDDLDHTYAETGLTRGEMAAFDSLCEMDADAALLKKYVNNAHSLLLLSVKDENEVATSIQDFIKPATLTKLPTPELEMRLKEMVQRLKCSQLATIQFIRYTKSSAATPLPPPLSPPPSLNTGYPGATTDSGLNFVTTHHIHDTTLRVEAVVEPEALLTVAIYPSQKSLVKAQEFIVLGSNKLSELRDLIYCLSDTIYEEELQDGEEEEDGSGGEAKDETTGPHSSQSHDADAMGDPGSFDAASMASVLTGVSAASASAGALRKRRPPQLPKEKLPRDGKGSAFFFIENVFYNDMRRADAVDYSVDVIEWVQRRAKLPTSRYHMQAGRYAVKQMSEVSFWQLEGLKLGYPYLFQHCGNCEHVVIFTEVRLYSARNCSEKNRLAYPLTTYSLKLRRRKCRICDLYSARFVTFNDKKCPENPTYFCKDCYVHFHYDVQGGLLYDDFQVFKYVHE